MNHKITFTLIPLFVIIVFSLTMQDSFGESRHECRVSATSDKSMTPVERHYALQTCSTSEGGISSFEKYYSEELHNECTRILKENTRLNHIARLNDLEECNKLQKIDASSKLQKITKFSKVTIAYCDEKYEIFLLVGAKKMWNQAGGTTQQCLKLYSAPMWNSTTNDRYAQLHNFLIDEVRKNIEESEELRQQGVEEAIASNSVFFLLKSSFDEQKEKIEHMENQLQEKNIILNYSQMDLFNEKYEDCLKIIYDDALSSYEKINALDECSRIQTAKSITFDEKEITEYSKRIVQFCESSREKFHELSRSDYYASMNSHLTSKCVMLYTHPIDRYNQEDRTQMLEKFVYDKIIKDNHRYIEGKRSVIDANLNAAMLPILSDLYAYQLQKIEMLEDFLKMEKIENTDDEN